MADRDRKQGGKIGNALLDGVRAVWNSPNELIGLTLGYVGQGLGQASHRLGLQKAAPRVVHDAGRGMKNFVNNPLAPMGAVTFGHASLYGDDPYDPESTWKNQEAMTGQSVFDHEAAHVPQGELLGPFYLPSNLVGGLSSLVRDRDAKGRPIWHGPSNWNERGPLMNPPRPWPPRGSRR